MSAHCPTTSDGGPGVSRTRRLGALWRSRPPVALHVCVMTGAPQRQRPSRCPPFHAPILPRCRPIVQRHLTGREEERHGDSPAHRALADQPLRFPGCASFVASSPGRFVTFQVCQWDRWGPGIGRERHRGSAGDAPPLRPHRRSNFDHAGKRYFVLG